MVRRKGKVLIDMDNNELQQMKMAWLAAEEAGDKQRQLALLRDYPETQEALIDFIAAYRITEPGEPDVQQVLLLPLTQRAYATALERVLGLSLMPADLRQLRVQKGLSLAEAARGLHLGIDVWKKFEDGVIELISLSERQLARLANFFQVSAEQFGNMLNSSQPVLTINRRQTAQAARSTPVRKKQSFAEAIEKSTMPEEEKQEWLA
jgi:transcriptional regulator with XRE-family HTH domain